MSPGVRRGIVLTGARFLLALALYAAGALVYRYVLDRSQPTLFAVTLATIGVAVALWAARDPLDRLAGKVALGSRADGYDAVHGLLRELSSTLPVDEVVPRIAEAAGRTVGGPSAEVRLWLADGGSLTESWRPESASAGPSLTVGVGHGGAEVGEIEVQVAADEVSAFDRRLLDDLAGPAGLALSTVRLTHDLRRRRAQLAELNKALVASRDRLLTARRSEQERLRAEVQDRVIVHIDDALRQVDGAGAAQLQTASRATADALDSLRLIARGIFPPRLGESGLAAALDGWLERADIYSEIEIDDPDDRVDRRPEHEVCIYFCAVTVLGALANVDAQRLRIGLDVEGERARLAIRSTGDVRVPDDVRTVVRDRVDAFGGTVAFAPGETLIDLSLALDAGGSMAVASMTRASTTQELP